MDKCADMPASKYIDVTCIGNSIASTGLDAHLTFYQCLAVTYLFDCRSTDTMERLPSRKELEAQIAAHDVPDLLRPLPASDPEDVSYDHLAALPDPDTAGSSSSSGRRTGSMPRNSNAFGELEDLDGMPTAIIPWAGHTDTQGEILDVLQVPVTVQSVLALYWQADAGPADSSCTCLYIKPLTNGSKPASKLGHRWANCWECHVAHKPATIWPWGLGPI